MKNAWNTKNLQIVLNYCDIWNHGSKIFAIEDPAAHRLFPRAGWEKLERAASAAMREAAEMGANSPVIQMLLVSTGGFTDNVLTYVKTRNDIYCSDHAHINAIFRFYGGNYDIPVF